MAIVRTRRKLEIVYLLPIGASARIGFQNIVAGQSDARFPAYPDSECAGEALRPAVIVSAVNYPVGTYFRVIRSSIIIRSCPLSSIMKWRCRRTCPSSSR